MATGVSEAASYTVDLAGDLATSTRDAARSASNSAQNAVTRARNEAQAEDVVNIHASSTAQSVHPVENALQHKHFVKEATRWGVAEHDVSFTGANGFSLQRTTRAACDCVLSSKT